MRRFAAGALSCWALLLALAFVAAPHACEWGLSAYTWTGLACVVGLGAVPFFTRSEITTARRSLLGLGLAVGTVLVWLGGLFAADVRIMCRLF